MADVNGKYVQEKAENVDAYMEAIGVPWLIRKTAANITPSLGNYSYYFHKDVCFLTLILTGEVISDPN